MSHIWDVVFHINWKATSYNFHVFKQIWHDWSKSKQEGNTNGWDESNSDGIGIKKIREKISDNSMGVFEVNKLSRRAYLLSCCFIDKKPI